MAGPPPWADAPYSYYSQGAELDKVLQDFAGSFSLSLNMGRGLSGTVNGRFNTKNPTEFISKLGSVYGFTWFTHAGTLHITRADDLRTTIVPLAGNTPSQLREALQGLGVLDTRFGWGELPEQGLAMISGPPAYVDLVERTVKLLPSVAGGQQVAVFRLKYASVDDRTIFFRDKEILTPGVVTILRNLIMGTSGGGRSGVNNEALAAIAAPLRAAPAVISEGNGAPTTATGAPANGAAPPKPGAAPTGNRVRTPSIQADVRLNSIIVQDIPERMPVYERLIRELDVPTALIEIQAMIVDVNSQRMGELGIQWGARSHKAGFGYGNPESVSGTGTVSLNWSQVKNAVNPSTLVVDSASYLVSRIRVLEGDGEANIRSTPSVLTMDNQGALFDHSQTFYVRVQGERVASVTPITAGTTLRVTPRVVESQGTKSVLLVVDIEDGKIAEVTVDTLPTVQRSGISTQAVVGDSEIMVIGGYNNEQETRRVDRIPVIGEIPVVGALFSNKTTDRQKQERLFLIKPKIVTLPPKEIPEPAESRPATPDAGDATLADRAKQSVKIVSSTPSPANMPKISDSAQKARDTDRKRILESELAGEQKSLEQARKDLTESQAAPPAEKKVGEYTERQQAIKDKIAQHERNISAINKELAAIK